MQWLLDLAQVVNDFKRLTNPNTYQFQTLNYFKP